MHVTNDTGPQCPSVNSVCVCVCVWLVQYCIVQPKGPVGGGTRMRRCYHIPFTSHLFACLKHTHTHRHTHTHTDTHTHTHMAPGLPCPLEARKHRCGSRLMLYGPRARIEARTHTHTHTHTGNAESCCPSHNLKTICGTCEAGRQF